MTDDMSKAIDSITAVVDDRYAFCQKICDVLLHDYEIEAHPEWMGGGIVCITVPQSIGVDDGTFVWGTANPTWGAEYYRNAFAMENGEVGDSVQTAIPWDSTDVDAIAKAIWEAL